MLETIRGFLAIGAHWSFLEVDAQPPPRHKDLVGQVNPGIRIHTVPLLCALHTGGTSLRPTLRPSERSVEGGRSLTEEGGGEARPERKSHPPPAFPESRPLEETPTSFPSMFLCP